MSTAFLQQDNLPSTLRNVVVLRYLKQQQKLFRRGEQATAVFIVKTGRLKILRPTDSGKNLLQETVTKGHILAENALIEDFYPYTAIAEVPSQVIAYPKQVLLFSFREYPELAQEFIILLSQKIQNLQHRLEWRNIRAAQERVLVYLNHLAQHNHQSTLAILDYPLKEVAAELGLTPETLSRALTRLEQEGKITRFANYITLHHPKIINKK
ncbi:transcriptional regulator, Crp/Fnr family [Gloeothece citriformis PCC 7424]|uniref:Transcriptional regulator, Crp/Fnr family n=1 Tax=Gloeothece citriformis (strain PCC 7424) TaxID=65393 RepID=B7KI19_GLOC7|nr:Crp/Fnr family transcriptional regulator [Gloeothece citriformis]ACK72116.1 transcriptional regulator, Crp/Fnr family [Gloeothece citriformis PCC 7424]